MTIGSGDREHQRQAVARALKVRHANVVTSALQLHGGNAQIGWMLAILVDDGRVVQKEPGAVVGNQREGIAARFVDPKPTVVIDRKPFEAVR